MSSKTVLLFIRVKKTLPINILIPSTYTLFYISCSIPLQVGKHDYVDFYGTTIRIELIPVRTIYRGLCYKLKLSNPLPSNSIALNPDYFIFQISSFTQGIDKMDHIDLMIAANNTWQGIVGNNWPYSQGQEISK